MASALAIGIPLGVVAGVLAVFTEFGLLIDSRRTSAPTPRDHLQVFVLISGSAIPSIAVAALDERPVLLVPYVVSAASVFVIGLAVLAVYWRRKHNS